MESGVILLCTNQPYNQQHMYRKVLLLRLSTETVIIITAVVKVVPIQVQVIEILGGKLTLKKKLTFTRYEQIIVDIE